MKLVQTKPKLSYRDKLDSDEQLFVCPVCVKNGYDIASTTFTVEYSGMFEKGGKVKLSGRGKELRCAQCSEMVANYKDGAWRKIS